MSFLDELRRIALRVSILGAIAAAGLTVYAGRDNPSWLLRLIFVAWAVSPLAGSTWAISKGWAPAARTAFYAVVIPLTAVSLGFYSRAVSADSHMKLGAVFLLVPAASWALLCLTVLALRRR